jgi:hypothetical protein
MLAHWNSSPLSRHVAPLVHIILNPSQPFFSLHNTNLTKRVGLVQIGYYHQWYSWKIAELALNNNHSLKQQSVWGHGSCLSVFILSNDQFVKGLLLKRSKSIQIRIWYNRFCFQKSTQVKAGSTHIRMKILFSSFWMMASFGHVWPLLSRT